MQVILQFVEKYFIFVLVLFLISYLVPRESYQKYFHLYSSFTSAGAAAP